MYYEPATPPEQPRVQSFDQAIDLAEEWGQLNKDMKPIPSNRFGLNFEKGKLVLSSRKSGNTWPLTRVAINGLLGQLKLPSSLGRLFEERQQRQDFSNESRAERAMEFINEVMGDLKTTVVVRRRGPYVRAILGGSDPVVNYADVLRSTREAFSDLKWKERPKMFKEFMLSDAAMPLSFTRSRTDADADLRTGSKLIVSETGAYRPDIYTYVYRLVCSNGLVAARQELSRNIRLNEFRANLSGSLRSGLERSAKEGQQFAADAVRLKEYIVRKPKDTSLGEFLQTWLGRNSELLRIPKGLIENVATQWFMERKQNKDKTLWATLNAVTSLAKTQDTPEGRNDIELIGGRLATMSEGQLKKLVA